MPRSLRSREYHLLEYIQLNPVRRTILYHVDSPKDNTTTMENSSHDPRPNSMIIAHREEGSSPGGDEPESKVQSEVKQRDYESSNSYCHNMLCLLCYKNLVKYILQGLLWQGKAMIKVKIQVNQVN